MAHLSEIVPASLAGSMREQDRALSMFRGPSEAIGSMWARVRSIAPGLEVLLIKGESGCCADSVVQLLHSLSRFRSGALLKLDHSTAGQRLRNPRLLLRIATGGVIYVSDIDLLSSSAQDDLRRLLRLNRNHQCAIIVHTSQNLLPLAALGGFSVLLAQDLSATVLQIPALRERSEDIPALAELLLREACTAAGLPPPTLAESFMQEATSFAWPGNLDQFRSACLLLSARTARAELGAADLRAALKELSDAPVRNRSDAARMVRLDLVVREHVASVLSACRGNKQQASEVLGIDRSTIYRILAAS